VKQEQSYSVKKTMNIRMELQRAVWTLCVLAACFALPVRAQDVTGDWQGTVAKYKGFRFTLRVSHTTTGALAGEFYSIDQSCEPERVASISMSKGQMRFDVPAMYGAFEGELSADANSMRGRWLWTNGTSLPMTIERATAATAWKCTLLPHEVRRVTVDRNVEIEVLDWGGTGRAVVLLAGLGRTAHVYDRFASDLAAHFHVYAITRRGFGASTAPEPSVANYAADRLGDDVLAIIDALHIDKPVVVGHSIAGEELSSIASRHPEKVSGVVYLDCYAYAFYDAEHGDLLLDAMEVRNQLEQVLPGHDSVEPVAYIQRFRASLAQLEKILQFQMSLLGGARTSSSAANVATAPNATSPARPLTAADAVTLGERKFTSIGSVPCLAIFAEPHEVDAGDAEARAKAEAIDLAATSAQSKAMEAGLRTCRIVRLPGANHSLYLSNEDDVLREVTAFIIR
jgi:non-heme chloroperoxidase